MKQLIFIISFLIPFLIFAQNTSKALHSRHVKSVYMTLEDDANKKNNQREYTRYDSKGNVIEYIEFDKDSIPTKWEQYTYNGKGEVQTEKTLSAKGNLKSTITYDYNHLGQTTSETTTDENNKLKSKISLTYNGMGDKIQEVLTDEEGKVKETKVYEYDNKGLLTLRKTMNAKGETIIIKKYVYEY